MEQNNIEAQRLKNLKYKFSLIQQNFLHFKLTSALSTFLKMPLLAATHAATWL
jgi:hypothetical protein